MTTSDPESICAAMADDMALMVPSAPVQEGKAAFLRAVLPSLLQEFERHVSYTSAEVRVFTETAFDRGTLSFSVTPRAGGPSEVSVGKYLWFYIRRDDTWRLARVIVSLDEMSEHAST